MSEPGTTLSERDEGPVEPVARGKGMPEELPKLLAEATGTFTLIFIGAGAIMSTAGGLVGVALAHGLAIAIMVSAMGHISGGHYNPAVTFGFLVTRRIQPGLAGAYWGAQLVGATVAALCLRGIYPTFVRNHYQLGTPSVSPLITDWKAVFVEAVLTFFLVLVVFATAVDSKGAFAMIAGLAIGLVITMDIFMGGPLTGAAMNPARWFGPALVQGDFTAGWVYIVGPLLGGALAALLYDGIVLRPRGEVPG